VYNVLRGSNVTVTWPEVGAVDLSAEVGAVDLDADLGAMDLGVDLCVCKYRTSAVSFSSTKRPISTWRLVPVYQGNFLPLWSCAMSD
jgi:hypothetical protein